MLRCFFSLPRVVDEVLGKDAAASWSRERSRPFPRACKAKRGLAAKAYLRAATCRHFSYAPDTPVNVVCMINLNQQSTCRSTPHENQNITESCLVACELQLTTPIVSASWAVAQQFHPRSSSKSHHLESRTSAGVKPAASICLAGVPVCQRPVDLLFPASALLVNKCALQGRFHTGARVEGAFARRGGAWNEWFLTGGVCV